MRGGAVLALATLALVAACSSPQRMQERRQARSAQTFLERQGSIGDPGRVAAADFAFAKMAREEGTWTAFRAYAAPDALMDTADGYAPATQVLAGRADPAEPIRWAPTDVWSSCDGKLAVTLGRFRRPNGLVGDYITVWELQPDNSYKWIYDTGTPDNPQPAPQVAKDIPEDAIVVPGLTAIQGRVADCPGKIAQGESFPELSETTYPSASAAVQVSPDRSLMTVRYRYNDGATAVAVHWVRDGEAQLATSIDIPAS